MPAATLHLSDYPHALTDQAHLPTPSPSHSHEERKTEGREDVVY